MGEPCVTRPWPGQITLLGWLRFRHKAFIATTCHGDAEAAGCVVELDWRNVIDDRHACQPKWNIAGRA